MSQTVTPLVITPDAYTQGAIEAAIHEALGVSIEKRDQWFSGDPLTLEDGSQPSIIIADANAPEIDVTAMTLTIKKAAETTQIPMILFAPAGKNKIALHCLQQGASAVLEAPLSTDELVGTMWWLLRDQLFAHVAEREGIPTGLGSNTGVTAKAAAPTEDAADSIGWRPGHDSPISMVDAISDDPDAELEPPPAAPSTDDKPTSARGGTVLVDEPPAAGAGKPGAGAAAPAGKQPPAGVPIAVGKAFPFAAPAAKKPAGAAAPAEPGIDDAFEDDSHSSRMRLFGYEIESMIGSGGMATVYRARQVSLERPVAIKVISRDLAESLEFTQRFAREARVQASLSHPNIVQVFDLGSSGPLLYIVMELVRGDALRHWIEGRRLGPAHWLYIAHVMGEVMSYMHSRNVVHRDIKPANLLISRSGGVKLSDFGIAYRQEKLAVARLTEGRVGLGTPFFMPPEQKKNPIGADHRADIFALAVMFHVMIVGGITVHPLPSVRLYNPKLPVGIDEALRPALDPDPFKRPNHVRDLTEAFIQAMLPYAEETTGQSINRASLYFMRPFQIAWGEGEE